MNVLPVDNLGYGVGNEAQAKRLYMLSGIASVAIGLSALLSATFAPAIGKGCLFRACFGVPCIGCGTTRGLKALMHGDVCGALAWNPNVGLMALVALCVLACLSYDGLTAFSRRSAKRYMLPRAYRLICRPDRLGRRGRMIWIAALAVFVIAEASIWIRNIAIDM